MWQRAPHRGSPLGRTPVLFRASTPRALHAGAPGPCWAEVWLVSLLSPATGEPSAAMGTQGWSGVPTLPLL